MTLYRASPPKLPAPPASGRTSPIPRPFDLERESRVTYARCSFSTSLLSFIADGRHARRLAVLQKAITRRRRRRSRLRCDPAIRGFPPARPACASGRDSLTANTLLAHAPVVNPARLDHQPAVPERTVCQSGARRDDRRRSQGRAKHGRGVCPARCAEPARVSEPPEPEPDGAFDRRHRSWPQVERIRRALSSILLERLPAPTGHRRVTLTNMCECFVTPPTSATHVRTGSR